MAKVPALKSHQWLRISLMTFSSVVLLILVGLPILAIILFAIFPQLDQGSLAHPLSRFVGEFHSSGLFQSTSNSVMLGLSVVSWSLLFAVPLALLRQFLDSVWGKLIDTALMLPFLIPPYIGAMAWIQLLQRHGFIEQWWGFNLGRMLFSQVGLSLVMALHLFPLVYFSASSALATTGSGYLEAAAIYGAGPWKRLIRIRWPLMMPALIASALMIFVLTIEEFGAPDMIGRRFGFEVMVTAIHNKLSDWPIDLPGAAILSLVLIALAMLAYQFHCFLNRRYQVHLDAQQLVATKQAVHQFVRWGITGIFMMVILLSVILPLISISVSALMNTQSGGMHWHNLSFNAFGQIISHGSDAMQALMTSLSLAFSAACFSVLLALMAAYTLIRLRPFGSSLLEFLTVLPNAVPGMAVAVGLILTWNQPFWSWSPYNSLGILLLAYLCLMLPYPMRMMTAALRRYPISLDEAGFVFGANEWQVLFKILAPLLVSVALASGMIVFAISTRELVASLMLAPPGAETVATYVFNQFDQGSVNVGMAMSLLAIVISGTFISLGQWLQKKVSVE